MANKASFSPDEWTKVLQSVMMAGIAVTAAEPSGLWGTVKESMVAGRALLEATSDTGSNELRIPGLWRRPRQRRREGDTGRGFRCARPERLRRPERARRDDD